MDICATNIFKSWNRWPWYCFKLRPLFLPPPGPRENRLSESQEGKGFSFCSGGCRVAWAPSAPPVWWARNPGLRAAPGRERLESQAARECVSAGGFCLTFPGSLLSVLWSPNVRAMKIDTGDVSSPLPHRPTAWSMAVVAANSFSEEAQRKPRKDCPQRLPDSTTMNIKFNANRRRKRENPELWFQ